MNRTFDYLFPLVGSDLIDPTPDLFRPATGRTTPPSGAYINYRTPGGNIDETDQTTGKPQTAVSVVRDRWHHHGIILSIYF